MPSEAANDELAMVTIFPHTTALRENRWELPLPKSFLKSGAFYFQQIQSVSAARLMRRMGKLTDEDMDLVADILRKRLAIS